MADILIRVGILLAMLCAGALLFSGLFSFLSWVSAATVACITTAIEAVIALVIAGARQLAGLLQIVATWVARAIWRAICSGARVAKVRMSSGIGTIAQKARDWFSRRSAAWRAEASHDDTSASREDDADDTKRQAEDNARTQDAEHTSEYERALDLLGLLGVERLTRLDVKRRQRELISVVHPDKGFPNRVFAQQVNEAVAIINRHHNWR